MSVNTSDNQAALPLSGLRILDLCDRIGQGCGRQLADLGAEVILVEPPGGMASRLREPLYQGQSLTFAARNANKKSVVIDLAVSEGKEQFLSLLKSADIVLDGTESGYLNAKGLGAAKLRALKPELLVLSISDFGLQGPYKDFKATEAVHMAMGGELSRSGTAGNKPLLPPGDMALETAAIQAAWVALLAYWQRLHTGQGDTLDFSINDAVAQILDPPIGVTGSASAGRTAIEVAIKGRTVVDFVPGQLPSLALMYPVFKCVDGYVRACVLNPRQWQAMSAWLGPDHHFKHPKYGKAAVRLLSIGPINELIAALFADKTREELVLAGREKGIPIASVAQPSELFNDQHFAARDFFVDLTLEGATGKVPAGYQRIDGQRVGFRQPAPAVGQDTVAQCVARLSDEAQTPDPFGSEPITRRPLAGLLVLDLGVIVAGAELGRLFADQGARVIKLENKAFGDGMRQSFDSNPVSIPFAQGNRGKQSLGLNLRSEKGIELFKQLVEQADIVLSNFKPGTMDKLGIGYEVLQSINPRIICAESSAMGSAGPEASTMGYGPLVRASTSLSGLWRYPEQEAGFADVVTIYPDHFSARVSATAILAKLIQRRATGVGGFVDLSQAECIMNVLAPEFLRESLAPGTMVAKGNSHEFNAPDSVFSCQGDDQWCVVSVTSDYEWQGLCRAMGRDDLAEDSRYASALGRVQHREQLEAMVTQWSASLSPYQVMMACQAQGVPAGNMLRLSEFLQNPHYKVRHFFRLLDQPTAGRLLETENGPVGFSETLPPPVINRAPAQAEHTRELIRELLELSDQEIDTLVAAGDLEIGKPADWGVARQRLKTLAVSLGVKTILKVAAIKARLK
ncbi:CaiB/BaiF CoA transferase family protein [Oceanicoccus sagamiensis]|uniref:CoA transferase n=1 Tax=Oceanicoccus sagamiensis TaxID=716816 RepID=A0A1X9N7I3_9GAMM|nr:CoA transferase [Oceanicoccus sagamiensis]ARN73084.1 hypothetical protein BST96_02555 [Oceanicoccus sagamiensis]